jgi:hypothetical protein
MEDPSATSEKPVRNRWSVDSVSNPARPERIMTNKLLGLLDLLGGTTSTAAITRLGAPA